MSQLYAGMRYGPGNSAAVSSGTLTPCVRM